MLDGFQYLEERDANDTITHDGVASKKSAFATADNAGIYDVIAKDLRLLAEAATSLADNTDAQAILAQIKSMYTEMKSNPNWGDAAAKAQAEEALKQAKAAAESAAQAKEYGDKATELAATIAEIENYIKTIDDLKRQAEDTATIATNKANFIVEHEKAAADSEAAAASSAAAAKTSETNAKTSETNAASSASAAASSESAAKTSETNAKTSEVNAKTSETNASTSKSNASASEAAAKSYMDTAKEYMQKAQEALAAAQAIQSIVDTAKSNAEKCLADVEAVKESLAKMITYQGSVDNYSDLPTSPQVGYSYNVKNADKAHGVNAGDNLVWNGTDWDNFGSYVDMSLFAELGKDARFNSVTATTFTGNLIGTANKATSDANGNNIANTYETKSDSNTKFNGTTSYTNRLQRNKEYKVGDIAYDPNLPSWAYLECVTAGTTGDTEPDFSEVK